jgi:GalNAc-alpha-(1->4)-GalNAc-alpha-(1->3)-diNAcBac-PP-undecaprenol alpha-1,4-N-acetyl-D-galactosaminyltransferase
MKIIFLVSSLGAGGAERVATTLCNAWAARGDQVTLVPTFSGGGKPFYEVSNNVKLIYLADLVGSTGKTPLNYIRRLFALRSLIAREKADVVISFLPNVNVAAIVSSASLSVPVICCERSDPSVRNLSFFWKMACRFAYRYADVLVVQTNAVANSIGNIFPHLKEVRTIANPLPNGVISLKKEVASGTQKALLSLGRLSDVKQVAAILNAFASVASDHPDWVLHIYGDGPLRAQLRSHIYTLCLQNRAFLMGRTDTPWQVMAKADAFVMASKYEGFPNALLEAMAIGLPCVTFDCPSGPREISMDGKVALLVSLNDEQALAQALQQLMGDADLRQTLGENARASVIERYALDNILQQWDALFVEVGAKL